MSYLKEMNDYADRVEELLAENKDIRVVAATAIHDGWDDGVIIACGESKATVIARLCNGKEMDLDKQVKSIIPRLRDREAKRIAEEDALMSSVARFYV